MALEAVRRIDQLFDIEREVHGLSAQQLRIRQERSTALLSDFEAWLQAECSSLSRSSNVIEPISYRLKRWESFARFVHDVGVLNQQCLGARLMCSWKRAMVVRSSAFGVRALRLATSLSRASARAAIAVMASTMAFNVPSVFGRLRSGGVISSTRANCGSFLLPSQLTDSLRRSAFTQQSPAA